MEDNGRDWKGFFTFYTCRSQVVAMNECLSKYYSDTEFREECKQIYVDRRQKYRATGIMEKDPYVKKPYYESERKKEFLAKMKQKKDEEAQH